MLKNIRKALIEKKDNPYPSLEAHQTYFKESDEMLEVIFANEFTRINGNFIFCENEISFLETLINLAEEKKWKNIYCWESALQTILTRYEYPFMATDAGFENADAGITFCEALVARTGSVLISNGNAAGRRLSIYPSTHIVLAYTSQMVPDIREGLKLVQEKYNGALPTMICNIAGPSRTADIEKTLVLGAHGPKELYVFLVDDSLV